MASTPAPLIDRFARHITYLRVSVTDRCDFRCVYCMSDAMTFLPRQELLTLEEIDRLAQPPSGYGVFLSRHEDGTVDVFTGGRKLRVAVSPSLDVDALQRGQEVLLNDALNIVDALGFERAGEVVSRTKRVVVTAGRDTEVSLDDVPAERVRRARKRDADGTA